MNTEKPVTDAPTFNFETTKLCNVNLDLGLKGYPIIVELYTEKPVNEDGQKIEGLNPVYRGITGEDGKLTNDVVDLPKGTETVYFHTVYLGIQNMIPIKVVGNDVRFSVNDPAAKSVSKFATKADVAYKDDRAESLPGVKWDNVGRPSNLEPREDIPAGLYYDIRKVINGKEGGAEDYIKENYRTELNLVKSTGVKIVFANENASMKNTVCYYHYPTGQKPTRPEDVKLIIAFPNSSFPDFNETQPTGLSTGDNIKIKYWTGTEFVDEFPAGTTIAYGMMTNTFRTGAINKPAHYFYANHELNVGEGEEVESTKEHVIVLHHESSDTYVHMIEDRYRNQKPEYNQGNFHDAILYFKTDVRGAIDSEEIPTLPESPEIDRPTESEQTGSGTIAFEDLWPNEGDYDMNDVVIEYTSTAHKDQFNNVFKLVDVMKVVNSKGSNSFECQFGYQFNTSRSQIKSVKITPTPTDTDVDLVGLEQMNETPTVILFKDNTKNIGKEYTVTTLFSQGVKSEFLIPPYNPFIAVTDRGREVHLTNHIPTPRVNMSLFGQGNDRSIPEQNRYYISQNKSFPFAIKIPTLGFILPSEKSRIDEVYPRFTNWVETNGKEDQQWYKHPKEN